VCAIRRVLDVSPFPLFRAAQLHRPEDSVQASLMVLLECPDRSPWPITFPSPLTREAARAPLLVFFLMTSITAMAASMIAGLLTPQTVALSVLGLPVMWIGTRLGEIAFSRGTSDMHRRVSIVVLNVIAIIGAVQGMREIA
jgi:hypothetical protein